MLDNQAINEFVGDNRDQQNMWEIIMRVEKIGMTNLQYQWTNMLVL